ncbi:MAG: TonB family protein [Bacteroidota bacterium]|nr:TonB family protein [Bacteroidota bacterium]
MKNQKSPSERARNKKLEKSRFIFLEIGLIITLLMVLAAFEWNTEINRTLTDYGSNWNEDIIQIEITEQEKPKQEQAQRPEPQITQIEIASDPDEANDIDIDAGGKQDTPNFEDFNLRPEPEENVPDPPFVPIPEVKPEFPGGMQALYQYLANNIIYTDNAKKRGIRGKVYVYFVVEPDGSLSNIDIVRGLGYGLDEVVLDVIRNMPRWKPGMQGNIKARVPMTLPVKFNLQ